MIELVQVLYEDAPPMEMQVAVIAVQVMMIGWVLLAAGGMIVWMVRGVRRDNRAMALPYSQGTEEMFPLPTPEENPHGLHQRYSISKANGEPVDPNGIYFVLRLDGGGDDLAHIWACRAAARAYAQTVVFQGGPLARVGHELHDLLDNIAK